MFTYDFQFATKGTPLCAKGSPFCAKVTPFRKIQGLDFLLCNSAVIKVPKNYAMCAIAGYNKLAYIELCYSIVFRNYAITML